MDYNTSKQKLALPEYGRNIQQMVNYITTLPDKDERNRLAHGIIKLMGNVNPHLRDVNDFKHKLWEHLALISNYELDIDYPYPIERIENIDARPDKIPYKKSTEIGHMYYGRVLESMIQAAIDYPEGEDKDYLIETLCNQMKKSFLNWNKESVNDDLIFNDLKRLSNNKLQIPEGLKLKETKDLMNRPSPQKQKNNNTNNASNKRKHTKRTK